MPNSASAIYSIKQPIIIVIFILYTILKFVERVGGNFISHMINYDHWGGSLLFSFSKKSESDTSKRPYSVALSSNFILDNYEMFKDNMNRLKNNNSRYGRPHLGIWRWTNGSFISISHRLGFKFLERDTGRQSGPGKS